MCLNVPQARLAVKTESNERIHLSKHMFNTFFCLFIYFICFTPSPCDQGSCMAALLCASRPSAFRMAVFTSGFSPTDPDAMGLFSGKVPLAIPSLHIMGAEDALVPRQQSEDLATLFAGSRVLVHPGGHVVPVG